MARTLFDSNVLREAQDAMAFLAGVLEASTEYSIIGKGLDGTILLWNKGAAACEATSPIRKLEQQLRESESYNRGLIEASVACW